jgi:hypothetical protein
VVVKDGAGCNTGHVAKALVKLSIIKLPPYSPELKPLEIVALGSSYRDILLAMPLRGMA